MSSPPSYGLSITASSADATVDETGVEGITQQNERYKMVIQTLSRENEDLKRTKEASEWLIKQNKDMSDELKKLKIQLYHWQNSANDANDRLARLSLKKDKKNAGEIFYDASVKRIIETLANENHILLEKVEDSIKQPHRAELLKTIDAHEKTIQNLREANEYKYKENRRLQQSIKLLEENSGDKKLLVEIRKCQEKISFILQENTKLKAYLIQKHNVMEYLKNIFEKTKDEMIKIFIRCYIEDKDNFLDQLKDPGNEIPEFMTRPLVRDSEVQTDLLTNSIQKETQTEKFDSDRFNSVDSGIESLTIKETLMFEEVKTVQKHNQNLVKENQNLKETAMKEVQKLNSDLKAKGKILTELENELASWKTALTQANEEGTHFRQESENAKDQLKTMEVQLLNLKQQVPFHIDTRRLLKEKNELEESLKTMEAINHNLHAIIDPKHSTRSKQPAFKKSFSADTQASQSRTSRYPTESPAHYQEPEYLRNMQLQQQKEPWQTPWYKSSIGGARTTVIADGASWVRDSDDKKPQQTGGKISTPISQHQSSPDFGRKGSPSDQSRRTPEHQTAAQMMEGIGRSIREELFPCENCGQQYPSSIIWEHIRTCTSQQYDD